MLAGMDDNGVDQVCTDPVAQPMQVLGVGVLDAVGQLDLDAQHPAVRVLNYQIHFVVVVAGP
jgi:hypothetical protein